MWKVFLAFVTHRFFLFMVATLTLQYGHTPLNRGNVLHRFLSRVAQGAEARSIEKWSKQSTARVLTETRNPFHWICLAVKRMSGWQTAVCLLVVSNLFLFLFLSQLFSLFTRMVTTDVSTLATSFVLLWPTSYELSLGSSLTLACFLGAFSLREALEQKWWAAGLAGGFLAILDPFALALLPAFLYLFWSVQRFLPAPQWSRNLGFFLIPFLTGAGLSAGSWPFAIQTWNESALLHLAQGGFDGLFSRPLAGQTVCWIFFLLGAIGALFSNINPVHRFLALWVWAAWMLASPYSALASRAALAGICMEGVASAVSGSASRIASLFMILLGAYEVYLVFLG